MTTNEVLTKHNFVSKLVLKNGNDELSKDLKVKIMKMRIEYSKIRKQFDDDLQEFVKDLASDRFKELQQKNDRTDEENAELNDLTNKINSEYNSYIVSRSNDEVNCIDYTFSEDEYNEILEVNADNDVEINGTKISAPDFLEILYSLFVKD